MQTNVKLHVDAISNSGRTDEIKAIKIWRSLHGLEFPSFFLELATVEALSYRPKTPLADNVLAALQFFEGKIQNLRILDPANSNNIISDDTTKPEKLLIAQQARQSRDQGSWGNIIW